MPDRGGPTPGWVVATLGTPAAVDAAAAERLARYLALLGDWNPRVNLTGARTDAQRMDLLVRPVVDLAPRLPGGSLLDVGSGNGSPGLVLAALRPRAVVTLLEPRARRWAFLREAARAMALAHVDVRRERHDQYSGPPADVVTVRALRLPLPSLAPLVTPGGLVVIFGAEPAADASFAPEGWGIPGVHAYRR